MAAAGGMVSNSILPYLDYALFAQNPKAVVGHSDITAILLAIYRKTGVITYYGPNLVPTFGQRPPFLERSLKSLEAVLGEDSARPYTYPTPPYYSDEVTDWKAGVKPKEPIVNRLITVNRGKAAGRLLGGNLNTITGIMASPFMPEIKEGDILFLEDTEKFAAHTERTLSMLKLCGVFDKIGGLILGKHRKFNPQDSGRTPIDILLEIIGQAKFPILGEFDACHTVPMLTLPLGADVELDAGAQSLTLL